LHAVGILASADLIVFAEFCEIVADLRGVTAQIAAFKNSKQNGSPFLVKGSRKNKILNPLLRVQRDLRSSLLRYAVEFGLSPSARSRVSAAPAEEPDPADEFFQ
jgi:P27 family predicted phage terminase small subunit